jgi:catechol 2,3-dioxygenase-like lactoylglutathione lyase family enzyme
VITGVFHTGCTVSSLESALDFCGQRLGIEHVRGQVSDQPYLASVTGLPGCSLKLGFARIEGDSVPVELIECLHPAAGHSGTGFGIVGSAHQCWQVDNLDVACERLPEAGITLCAAPHTLGDGPWSEARGTFLRDPDGFLIELLELPSGHGQAGRLLSNHHFGLTVSHLSTTLGFLCGQLGLQEVSRYECDSAYIQHVSGLQDGRVLAAVVAVPGTPLQIELWQFRFPAGAPARVATNSIASGHVCFLVDDIVSTHKVLSDRGVRFVGPPAEVTAGVNKGAYAIYFWGPDNLRFELFQKPPSSAA